MNSQQEFYKQNRIDTMMYRVRRDAEEYLANFNLFLDIEIDNDSDTDYVGMYEHDSVFTGTIKVYLNLRAIEQDSEDDEFEYDVIITLYHEIGHALFDLVMSMDESDVKQYEEEYFNVFYDDNGYDEEELVEDFGQSFDPTMETQSELRNLLSRMLSDHFDFDKYIWTDEN